MNMILCGMPACGKTTIGKLLSQCTGWTFVDVDQMIMNANFKRTGKMISCKEIALLEGSIHFRHLEKAQIKALEKVNKAIIALGGGSLCDEDNAILVRKMGRLIYIQTPLSCLWERVKRRGLLSYLDESNPERSFFQVAESRSPLFKSLADLTIDAGERSEKEIADEIILLSADIFQGAFHG